MTKKKIPTLTARKLGLDPRDLWFVRAEYPRRPLGAPALSARVRVFAHRPVRLVVDGCAEWAAEAGSLVGVLPLTEARRLLGNGVPENARECVLLAGKLN